MPNPKEIPNARGNSVLCNPSPFAPLYIIKKVLFASFQPVQDIIYIFSVYFIAFLNTNKRIT